MPAKLPALLKSYGLVTLGALIHAVSYVWCYEPNQIAFGGLTGVSQIINYFIPALPVGGVAIVLNVPLFLLGWRLLGGHLLVSSLYAMAASSLFIDGLRCFLGGWFAPMDPMLAALAGGVLLGVSLGLVIGQGATTGGTDLLARLLKLKLTWLPMGRLLLAIDLVIILATMLAFHSLQAGLYGIVGLYISTFVVDQMLYGTDAAKVAFIISARPREVQDALVYDLDRGVTVLHGRGAYSGEEKEVLMCAFKQRQIVRLKTLVKDLDPAAFVIVCDAHDVLGDGFREYRQNEL